MGFADTIREKALEFGYEECGMIPVAEAEGYAVPLGRRIERFPEDATALAGFMRFARVTDAFPWAKSIIICVRRYGKYAIPETLRGVIGKYYLVDGRTDPRSPDYNGSLGFEGFLHTLKLRILGDRRFGITALRWAALKAGLGTVRHNNFFYTENSGSWVFLEAWLTDAPLELRHTCTATPCSDRCNACITACPTQSLSEPFAMNRATCVSYLTTFGGYDAPLNPATGGWLFGCDACQDRCPYNQEVWTNETEFPGLSALGRKISLERIITLEYPALQELVAEKFWYIPKEKLYKWKLNALNALLNAGGERYRRYIENACADENETVAALARRVSALNGY